MKSKRTIRFGAVILSAAFFISASKPAYAAESADKAGNSGAVNGALEDGDIIDGSRTGSIEIYKYDATSASKDGVWDLNGSVSDGEKNETVESVLKDYAMQGVEFSYVYLGGIETYSFSDSGNSRINVVYEIDEDLADILGLKDSEAYDMTGENAAFPCGSDKLHFDSAQLSGALADLIESGDTAAKNSLEAYAESRYTGRFADTDKNGHTSISGLELGLYLIVETEVPEETVSTAAPWFVSVPFTNISGSENADQDQNSPGERWIYDAVCYPKNQTGNPTLDKMVRNAYGTLNPTRGVSGYNTDYVVSSFDAPSGAEHASQFVLDRNVNEGTDEYAFSDTTTASEGDILDYIVVSKLPAITSEATYLTGYTFTDELGEGLTYNKDARIAIYNNEADAILNNVTNAVAAMDLDSAQTTLSGGDAVYEEGKPGATWLYSQNYLNLNVQGHGSSLEKGATALTVSFTKNGLKMINEGLAQSADIRDYGEAAYIDENGQVVLGADGFSEYYIVLYYTATVNSDALVMLGDEGNQNNVRLVWKRTSQEYENTLEDRSYVYTYGIDLTKRFSDGKGDFSDVKFILYNETDGYYVVADTTEDPEGKNIYHVGGRGDIADTNIGKTVSKDKATVFVPNKSGKLFIRGIEADTYQMIEIATDDGYKLLAEPVTIKIEPSKREVKPAAAGYVGNSASSNAHEHEEACYDENGCMICGRSSDEDPNGRTIGKRSMYVGQAGSDFVKASGSVDGKAVSMNTSGGSENALITLEIENTETFLFPPTGGNGTMIFTLAGCGAALAGIAIITKSRRNGGSSVNKHSEK